MEPVEKPIKDMEVSNPWATFILDGPKVTEVRKNDPENWGATRIGDLVRVIEKGGSRTGIFRVCDVRTYVSLEDCYFGEGVRHLLPGLSTRLAADQVYLGFDGPEKIPQRAAEFAKHGAVAIQLERHGVQPQIAVGHPQVDTASKPRASADTEAIGRLGPLQGRHGIQIRPAETVSAVSSVLKTKGERMAPADCTHCWPDGSSTRVAADSNGLVDACCRCGEALYPVEVAGRGEKMSKATCPHTWDNGSDAVKSCGGVDVCSRCSEMFRSSFVSAWAK